MYKLSREKRVRVLAALVEGYFVSIHKMQRVTPAMVAGVTDKYWNLEDIVRPLEERELKK